MKRAPSKEKAGISKRAKLTHLEAEETESQLAYASRKLIEETEKLCNLLSSFTINDEEKEVRPLVSFSSQLLKSLHVSMLEKTEVKSIYPRIIM